MEFAGPLAQGVIDQFLFFVLVCYPPLSPRGPRAPAPGGFDGPGDVLEGCRSPGGPPRGPQKKWITPFLPPLGFAEDPDAAPGTSSGATLAAEHAPGTSSGPS